jgi:predicted RecB family nuclease
MRGLQCAKSLWLYRHAPELQDEAPPGLEAVFAQGTSVGRLAWELFPGGVDLSPEHVDGVPQFGVPLARTREEIAGDTRVLYEPAFEHDGVFAAVDMMVRDGGRWRAFEVKSGTSVKDVYATDAAVQHWVLASAGIDVADFSIAHIDNTYVRRGDVEVHKLFEIESVIDQAKERYDEIGQEVERLKAVLARRVAPEVSIGPHCSSPYTCSFHGHCWEHVPERSVFALSRIGRKAWELYERGVVAISDLPDDCPLNAAQRIEAACARSGVPFIDRKAVRGFAEALAGPLLFLDFETVGPAVPLFDGTRPYQAVPFQYSLHRREARGAAVTHAAFLGDGTTDPRPELVEQLLADTAGDAPILMYSAYERRVINELAAAFPKRARVLRQRASRLVDLSAPFRGHSYWTAEMGGSYSIKSVLPALAPEMSYDGMEIADGGAASRAYESLHYDQDPARVAQLRAALLDYCRLDTLAMVKVLEVLEGV